LEDIFLIKGQNQSDTAKSKTDKFMHVYQGPYIINKILLLATYQTLDNKGQLRGEFNKRQLKPCRTKNDPKNHQTYNHGVLSS